MKHNIKALDAQSCIGCLACKYVCPIGCINKTKDSLGFEYPSVDESKCIECGRCIRACPVLNQGPRESNNYFLAAQATDYSKRIQSSSGGIFRIVAEKAQAEGYAIYGAVLDSNHYVRHIRTKESDFTAMCGSKYVQSDISDVYQYIKEDIQNGIKVMFSGTPCQVAAIKRFAESQQGYKKENFLFVDLICHGVGSPKLWDEYVASIGNVENVRDISFRDKATGWHTSSFSFTLGDGKKLLSHEQCHYMRAYGENLCLRNACFHCQFKGFDRDSDMTLGDFWDRNVKGYDAFVHDDTGISTVIAHSDKILRRLEALKRDGEIILQTYSKDRIAEFNKCAVASTKPSKKQRKFLKLLAKGYPLEKAVQVASKRSFPEKCANKIVFEIKKILK